MVDLGFVGHKFTWSNKRPGQDNIQERLDQCVANDGWRAKFSGAMVIHLTQLHSDHCSILVTGRSRGKIVRGGGGLSCSALRLCGFRRRNALRW